MSRKPYPSDVTDEEWAFVAPYLILMREDAAQREHDLHEVFNGLPWIEADVSEDMVHDLRALIRLAKGKKEQPTAAIFDGRTVQFRKVAKELGMTAIRVRKAAKFILPRRWVVERIGNGQWLDFRSWSWFQRL